MNEKVNANEVLESYLQADEHVRGKIFKAFREALKIVAYKEGKESAEVWAKRAISPDLDYSSLMVLNKFLYSLQEPPFKANGLRLGVLGGPTTIQLVQLIRTFLTGHNVAFKTYEAEYGLFRQEILTADSGLDIFKPQIVFLATGTNDILRMPSVNMSIAEVRQMVKEEAEDWIKLWEIIHEKWDANVIHNMFEVVPWSAMGHYAVRHRASKEYYIEQLNEILRNEAPPYVTFHDIRTLITISGAGEWLDPRFYLEAKLPCGPECLVTYAHSVTSLILGMIGKSKKVLVLDLDNTLWGGTIGDVGIEGIRLGQGSGEGEAYLYFQKYVKELKERGIILSVCSKNYENIAKEPFEKRKDMVLKLSDISCFIANWKNKAENLREISRQLELGLDTFVFVDDNPIERALVRRFVPEVSVPDIPDDPAGYIQALFKYRYFEMVSYTSEDASRASYYTQNIQRKKLAEKVQDLDVFLASLDMQARVEPVNNSNIERVTQLINKSNQFNLTTRRRTLSEIEEIVRQTEWKTLTISLNDKLGDNGLISVIFLHKENNEVFVIDTWLMSCRVLQRGVEQFALNEIVKLARQNCYTKLQGVYIPTDKNKMVCDHFTKLGFRPGGSKGNITFWDLQVDKSYQLYHTYIKQEHNNE